MWRFKRSIGKSTIGASKPVPYLEVISNLGGSLVMGKGLQLLLNLINVGVRQQWCDVQAEEVNRCVFPLLCKLWRKIKQV